MTEQSTSQCNRLLMAIVQAQDADIVDNILQKRTYRSPACPAQAPSSDDAMLPY